MARGKDSNASVKQRRYIHYSLYSMIAYSVLALLSLFGYTAIKYVPLSALFRNQKSVSSPTPHTGTNKSWILRLSMSL